MIGLLTTGIFIGLGIGSLVTSLMLTAVHRNRRQTERDEDIEFVVDALCETIEDTELLGRITEQLRQKLPPHKRIRTGGTFRLSEWRDIG